MKKIIQQGLAYTSVKYIVICIGFLKSLLIAKYLGPSLLGSYAYIMLLVEYMSYYNLGVFSSMNREVSIYIKDKSKADYVEKIINISITFSLLCSMPILLIVWGLDILPDGTISHDIYQYRFHISALILLHQFKHFFIQYFRLFEKYILINIFELVGNSVMVLGLFLFIGKYFLDAAIYISIIGNIVVIGIGLLNIKNVKYEWDLEKIKYLIALGIPMLLYALSDKIFTTIDRVMIAQFLARSDLGYYQFGNAMSSSFITIINAITFIFYPKFLKSFHYKTKKELDDKRKILHKTIYIMEYCSTLIIMIGVLILPIFITIIMPQYISSIIIAVILLIGFCFKPIIFLTSSFLISNNKQLTLLPISIASLIVLAGMNYILIIMGYGINGLVVATAISYTIYSSILYLIIFRQINSIFIYWRLYIFFILGLLIILFGMPIYLVIFVWLILYISRTKNIINIVKVNFN